MRYQDDAGRARRPIDATDRRSGRRTVSIILGVLALVVIAGVVFYSGANGPQRTATTDHGTITSNSPTQTPAPIPNNSGISAPTR